MLLRRLLRVLALQKLECEYQWTKCESICTETNYRKHFCETGLLRMYFLEFQEWTIKRLLLNDLKLPKLIRSFNQKSLSLVLKSQSRCTLSNDINVNLMRLLIRSSRWTIKLFMRLCPFHDGTALNFIIDGTRAHKKLNCPSRIFVFLNIQYIDVLIQAKENVLVGRFEFDSIIEQCLEYAQSLLCNFHLYFWHHW